MGVLVHDAPVRYSKNEFARFNLPPDVANCAEYTVDFVKRLGGCVEEKNGVCIFRSYRDEDEFVSFPFLLVELGGGLMIGVCMNDLGGEFPCHIQPPLARLSHLFECRLCLILLSCFRISCYHGLSDGSA